MIKVVYGGTHEVLVDGDMASTFGIVGGDLCVNKTVNGKVVIVAVFHHWDYWELVKS